MNKLMEITRSVLRYVSGESEYVCRLCLSTITIDAELFYLEDTVQLDCENIKEITTFIDMIHYIGIEMEGVVPFMMCSKCAHSVKSCYIFIKMCQNTNTLWDMSLDKINKALDVTNNIGANIRTLHIVIGERRDDHLVFTSKRTHTGQSKKLALYRIKDLLRNRKSSAVKTIHTVCNVCGEHISKSCLRKHMNKHHNQRSPCPECHKVFRSKFHLQDHMERMHRPKRIQCPKCSKMFTSMKTLCGHDNFYHRAATCKLCFAHFPSKKELRQHLNYHDKNTCPHCDKTFVNKQTFKIHLKICGEGKPTQQFFCDICNKGYIRKNSLRSHLKIDHGFGVVYTCNWCSKKFDAISKLKVHIVKHTKEKNFVCNHCNGCFVTRASLTYHMRLHTGEKPFQCDQCDMTFLSSSRRADHRRKVHIGRVLQCAACDNKFITTFQLKKHMARHTNPRSRLYIEHINQ